jgi:hypothetical protein
MTTSNTRPEDTSKDRPPIVVGDMVISWWDDKPVEYGGPDDGLPALTFGLFSGRPPVRTCDLKRVAPADTPIPAQDARVTVTRRPASEKPHGADGTWRLDLPGHRPSWHRTKRDGTTTGLRQLAIIDWHDAQAATPRITAASLRRVPDFGRGVPSGQNAVIGTLDNGTEVELFRYYTDELRFNADEFNGLTVQEARDLFARKDIAYLQS